MNLRHASADLPYVGELSAGQQVQVREIHRESLTMMRQAGSRRWATCPLIVGENVGEGTFVHPSAVVMGCVTIGRDCVVGPNVVLGWDGFGYEKDDEGEWRFREHPFGVVIGDNVSIGAGTVIDRGRYRDTVIGAGTKIDANVFIAHNCLVGERCLVIANSQISGSCEIGDGCHIGPAAMLTDHVKVGAGGRCGLGSVVIRDVPAGVTVVGNPAKDIEERRQKVDVTSFGPSRSPVLPGLRLDAVASEKCKTTIAEEHPGSHGDIYDQAWEEMLGDGCEFSLPIANGHGGELEQRQRAAERGWRGAQRGAGRG